MALWFCVRLCSLLSVDFSSYIKFLNIKFNVYLLIIKIKFKVKIKY